MKQGNAEFDLTVSVCVLEGKTFKKKSTQQPKEKRERGWGIFFKRDMRGKRIARLLMVPQRLAPRVILMYLHVLASTQP